MRGHILTSFLQAQVSAPTATGSVIKPPTQSTNLPSSSDAEGSASAHHPRAVTKFPLHSGSGIPPLDVSNDEAGDVGALSPPNILGPPQLSLECSWLNEIT